MEVGISFEIGTVVSWNYTAPYDRKAMLTFFNSAGEILFRFAARYNEQALVMNSQLGSQWGQEERPSGFPLHGGCDTNVTVVAEHDGFRIFSNGRNFCYTFRHRRSISEIKTVCVTDGKVQVGKRLSNCQPGKVVYLRAIAPDKGRFTLSLLPCDPWETASPGQRDIALQFSARFDENPPVVVRNTYCHNHWGNEERCGGMPFLPCQGFILAVTWQSGGFEIAVNGWPFEKFSYRIPGKQDMTLLTWGLSTIQELK